MMPRVVSSTQFNTMTIGDEAEIRRTSVGTKVLMVGLAVVAVLGSFWSIVWFIRSYVEAPRISMAPMALAARESTPVVPTPVRPVTIKPAEAQPVANPPAAPAPVTAEAAPRAADAISDRWMPMAPPPAPEPAPVAPPETTRRPPRSRPPPIPIPRSMKWPRVPFRRFPAPRRCHGASRRRPPLSGRATAIRRCRVRAPTVPRRRAYGPRCRAPTTASRRNNHSIAAPASIRCGR